MCPFLAKLRVWLSPSLILLLFLIADVLTAIPYFTFGVVTIVVGALLASVNLAMMLCTAWQMWKKCTMPNPLHAEKSITLVTGGYYALDRSPIYPEMSGLRLAFALYVDSLIGILAVPLLMPVVARLHIGFEEEQLRRHFGPEWVHYEQRVRRWLQNSLAAYQEACDDMICT